MKRVTKKTSHYYNQLLAINKESKNPATSDDTSNRAGHKKTPGNHDL